jgi:DNA polymerase III sliding clamp (beta) subunit (PCNA family)
MTALAEAPTSIPVEVAEKSIVIGSALLKRAFTNGLLFAGNDYTLPVISALHLVASSEDKTLTVTATDRYKLLREVVDLEVGADWTAILSAGSAAEFISTVNMAIRSVPRSAAPALTVALTHCGYAAFTALRLTVGRFTVESAALIDGKYPNTEALLAQSSGEPDGPISLDTYHMLAFARINVGKSAMRMTVGHPLEPIRFSADKGRVSGLLMPVRER